MKNSIRCTAAHSLQHEEINSLLPLVQKRWHHHACCCSYCRFCFFFSAFWRAFMAADCFIILGFSSGLAMSSTSSEKERGQLFVWPWMGIVANVQTWVQGGRRVGESGSKLRNELTRKGFEPLRVHPLWNYNGHSGFAVVEFNKDWDGFKNAIMFEKDFEVNHCGKEDYMHLRHEDRGNRLFGWVAREDDYNRTGIIGDHLRKNGDLKSVSSKEDEDKRKDSKLVTKLAESLEMKNKCLIEMERKYRETSATLNKQIIETEIIIRSYNEEIEKMQRIARDQFLKISTEHEKATARLEAQRKELEQREKQLRQREFQNDNEKRKHFHEKEMNERAILEQKKADENMLRLAEGQKTQKEELHKKILELEKQLDAKQALELEIERMKGALQVMKHMGDDEDMDANKKMEAIQEKLEEKEEELEDLLFRNEVLRMKDNRNTEELQDAREELVSRLEDSRASIGVKMGELWNFNENRIASLKEGVEQLLKQWKQHRRRRTCG